MKYSLSSFIVFHHLASYGTTAIYARAAGDMCRTYTGELLMHVGIYVPTPHRDCGTPGR